MGINKTMKKSSVITRRRTRTRTRTAIQRGNITNMMVMMMMATTTTHAFTIPRDESPSLLLRSKNERVVYSYEVTDSLELDPSERPSIPDFLWSRSTPFPHDAVLSLPLLSIGAIISIFNVFGIYDDFYQLLQQLALAWGGLCTLSYVHQVTTGRGLSIPRRKGVVDDAVISGYAGSYIAAVEWLAYRTSPFCPTWLGVYGDPILPWMALGVFVFSLLAPAITLLASYKEEKNLWNSLCASMVGFARGGESTSEEDPSLSLLPALSETEWVRAQGLLAIGALACVFAPDAIAFALGYTGHWWDRVISLHPRQPVLESSTSLFALLATEASMVSHRAGKAGVAPFRTIVPVFAVVCLLLAILPTVAALYWLGDDVSFFSFFRE